MYWVYVITNPEGKKYTGSTSDIKERMKFHNDTSVEMARFHRTTYKKGPWRIIFLKEFLSRLEALKFEKYLKTGKGREWLERARLGG